MPPTPACLYQLIEQGSAAVPGVRGVILPRDAAIDELRRFRHRFRKRYDVEIDVVLLHAVVKIALEAWPTIRAHIAAFSAFVDECAKVVE